MLIKINEIKLSFEKLLACFLRLFNAERFLCFFQQALAELLDQKMGTEFTSRRYSANCQICLEIFQEPRFARLLIEPGSSLLD